ncbi:aldehyde dehydrogenase [Nemania serpens]|nr:aldehyde dehydrogenase [Nemania serpens]
MYGDICSRLTEPQYVEAKNDRKPDIYNPKDGALIADDLVELMRLSLRALLTFPGALEISTAVKADGPLGATAGIVPAILTVLKWGSGTVRLAPGALKSAPALAKDHGFIPKLSEKTPLGALALGTSVKKVGFLLGVFEIILGDRSTGALLTSYIKICKTSFTGNLKRITLELVSKSPAVVFDDTNPQNVNFGVARHFVKSVRLRGAYDEVLEAIRRQWRSELTLLATLMRPKLCWGIIIVNKLQLDRVSGFLERGLAQSTLTTGGSRDQISPANNIGFYGVPRSARPVFPVATLKESGPEEYNIVKTNDNNYEQMAGVFTQHINMVLVTLFGNQ